MKPQCITVFLFTCGIFLVKGGVITTYGLISPHQLLHQDVIVPHGSHYNSLEFFQPHQVHSGLELQRAPLAHPQVVLTSLEESGLPSELTKSRKFYNNPHVASALAEESLNFKKEEVTFDRPSERISRQEIAKLINNLQRVHHEGHHY